MIIGPAPMMRMLLISVRFGMAKRSVLCCDVGALESGVKCITPKLNLAYHKQIKDVKTNCIFHNLCNRYLQTSSSETFPNLKNIYSYNTL